MPKRPRMCTRNTLPCRCTTALMPQDRGAACRVAACAGKDAAAVPVRASAVAVTAAVQTRRLAVIIDVDVNLITWAPFDSNPPAYGQQTVMMAPETIPTFGRPKRHITR